MAADGTGAAGGGAVGVCLTKDTLQDAKCPAAIPNRRRISSLSRDAQRRAYQWCREYLGGAWRQVRPEELSICPVRLGWSAPGSLQTLPVLFLTGVGSGQGQVCRMLCWGAEGRGHVAGLPGGVARSSREVGLELDPTNRATCAELDLCGSSAEASATCSTDARYQTTCPVWARSPARCC